MSLAIGLTVVRVLLGAAIASHGTQKLFGWFGGYGLKGTGGWLESIGFRPGTLFAFASGASETLGGVLLALGLLGPVGPALIVATMLVAIFSVHIHNGFFAQTNGIEMPSIYALAALAFAFGGNGVYTVDALLGITIGSQPAVVWGILIVAVLGAFGNVAARRAPAAGGQPSAS